MIGDDEVDFDAVVFEQFQGFVAVPGEDGMVTSQRQNNSQRCSRAEFIVNNEDVEMLGI
jgi:hypothetical protein